MAISAKVSIRKFRWRDLGELTNVFNEVMGFTDSEKAYDTELMRQCLSLPPSDPAQHCYVAEAEGKLVGFALLGDEKPIRRAVASGGVLKEHRNLGIGRSLIRKAVEHAGELGAAALHIEVSSDNVPAHSLLESEGFSVARRYWQMKWERDAAPEFELPGGFHMRPFALGRDEETLTRLQNTAFSENWGFSPNTVEQISLRVRMNRCDPEGIILITHGDRPAAYNWTLRASGERRSTGWISMTGVHPDYRGYGLGKAVVACGIQYLKSRGVDAIELEVDSANAPATKLYKGLGFDVVGETVWYEKRLE